MDKENDGLLYSEFSNLLRYVCQDSESYKDYLTELDSATGDGDMGITISKGFKAIEKTLETTHKNIGQLLIKAGMDFNNAAGSTMGALFGMALMRSGKCLGDLNMVDLNVFFQIVSCAEESIIDKGKAEIGGKTMLDALDPARMSLKSSLENNDSIEIALEKAYLASEQGCEKTKQMQATSGRSRWLGERTLGHADPGAAFISLLFKSISENYKKVKN